MPQGYFNLHTEREALHTVKHNATQKNLKVLNKQSREAGMQQEQNVLVLQCCKSPCLALAPQTQQAYHPIFGRG